jgi:EAL domain-containing protein (putative c-di-GMP-specific phosphodiesterase class I)
MAVNVSARQFRHPDFTPQLLDLLRLSGANPYRLKLELTESMLLSDFEDVTVKMSELRSIGVNFALDDFGTGYSSLSYLKRLPLDQLKIDQSFVRDVLTDPNDAAIARTILSLARSLDLSVVAEGLKPPVSAISCCAAGARRFKGTFSAGPFRWRTCHCHPLDTNLSSPSCVGQSACLVRLWRCRLRIKGWVLWR